MPLVLIGSLSWGQGAGAPGAEAKTQPVSQSGQVDFGNRARSTAALECHPTKPVAAVGLLDGRIRLFDVRSGGSSRVWSAGTGAICSLSFSPDGRILASLSSSDAIRLWDHSTGKRLAEVKLAEREADPRDREALQFSADGSRFIAMHTGQPTTIWNTADWTLVATLRDQEPATHALDWSDDGSLIATMTESGGAFVWSALSGELLSGPFAHEQPGADIAFRPGTHKFAASCQGSLVRVWDADTRAALFDIPHPHLSKDSYWIQVEYSPSGDQLMTGHEAGYLRCWDAADGSLTWEIDYMASNWFPFLAHFVNDGAQILVDGNVPGSSGLVDAKDGRRIVNLPGPMGRPLRMSADQSAIVARGDRTVVVHERATGRKLYTRVEYVGGGELVVTPELFYNATNDVDQLCQVTVHHEQTSLAHYRDKLYEPELGARLAAGEARKQPQLKDE